MLPRSCAAMLLLAALSGCGAGSGPSEVAGPAATSSPSDVLTDDPTSSTAVEPTPSPPPGRDGRGTRIVVAESEFGPMLFDSTGQAIYLFDIERTPRPRCYGACADAWPPVLTTAEPVAGRGVESSLLATTERADGTVQVTYGGHPLYFYAHEDKREVKCHDVFLNGGNWYVVQPDGDPAPPG